MIVFYQFKQSCYPTVTYFRGKVTFNHVSVDQFVGVHIMITKLCITLVTMVFLLVIIQEMMVLLTVV